MRRRSWIYLLSLVLLASVAITFHVRNLVKKHERAIKEYITKYGYSLETNPFPHFETCERQRQRLTNLTISEISSITNKAAKNDRNFVSTYGKQTLATEAQDALPSRGILLSYPRSGNHLVRMILECLLGSPTYGYAREEPMHQSEIEKHNQTYISPSLYRGKHATSAHPFILKRHSYQHISDLYSTMMGEFIIYIVRDPLESLISHQETKSFPFRNYDDELHSIINNTRVYLSWFNKHKHLLYYEDITSKDQHVAYQSLYGLSDFLNVSLAVCNRCYRSMNNITTLGLKSLKRKAKAISTEHYYRDKYSYLPLIVYVPNDVYPIFERYGNSKPC
mmetsp:Transcript_32221/g.39634  ORF Transcript_32221/g.39634 Transcript_32221/m.39634 type:complete len:335 (+) Transcript_32221:78-1082(+)